MFDHVHTIAMVGISPDPEGRSLKAAHYFQEQGYRVIPVNPEGGEILGEKVYHSLGEIPFKVELVDVFRQPEEAAEVARAAVAKEGVQEVWFESPLTDNRVRHVICDKGIALVDGMSSMAEHRTVYAGEKTGPARKEKAKAPAVIHGVSPLPYAQDALEPYISRETLEYHYGKHYTKYVATLNKLVEGSGFDRSPLKEIIRKGEGALFNNAAQAFNHDFYFHCMAPDAAEPSRPLGDALTLRFGSVRAFRKRFDEAALALFGSGWVWLTIDGDGVMEIESTANADTPLRRGKTPLLACDVWEHAYYIDFRNDRGRYMENFWKRVNWDFVGEQYSAASGTGVGAMDVPCNDPDDPVCNYLDQLQRQETIAT